MVSTGTRLRSRVGMITRFACVCSKRVLYGVASRKAQAANTRHFAGH